MQTEFEHPDDLQVGDVEKLPIDSNSKAIFWSIFLFEVLIAVTYGFFVRIEAQDSSLFFSIFQDVNVTVLIGFGFVMSYLKNHSWSAIGLSFFICVLAVQIYPLLFHFWHCVFTGHFGTDIMMNFTMVCRGLYSAGVSIICFEVLIGNLRVPQLLLLIIAMQVIYTMNEVLIFDVIRAEDIGGSITIHLFGSCFGLFSSVTFLLGLHNPSEHPHKGSTFQSTIFGFIGSLFLWKFWPAFNAVLSENDEERNRVILNTHLSLAASALATFGLSPVINGNKFSVDEVLNATLAGGAIVGSSCNLIENPALSIFLGSLGGILATLGFRYMSSFLHHQKIYDTIGVINHHFIPGLIGGLASAISCAIWYDKSVRPASTQALIQLAATLISLFVAGLSGFVTGGLMRMIPSSNKFDDKVRWVVDNRWQ